MTFSTVSTGEHAAIWYLPDHPQCPVTGKYIVNPDGTIEMELFEDIQEKIAKSDSVTDSTWSIIGPQEYAILHGEADGKAITAFAARLIGMSRLTGSTRIERRQPRYTIESAFYTFNVPSALVKNVRFSPDCLARLAGWEHEPDGFRETQEDGSNIFTIKVRTQAPKIADLGAARITLTQEYRRQINSHDDRVDISKYGRIAIELDDEASVADVSRKYIRPIMYMLTLMCTQPEGVPGFEFSDDDCPWPDDDLPSGARPHPLWMTIRAPIGMRLAQLPKDPRTPLLLLDMIDWPKAVEEWLPWAQIAAAELQLMSLLLDSNFPWLETKFTTCAQMVEGLHRKHFPVSSSNIDENKKLVDHVLLVLREDGQLNSKKRSRIKSALSYLYEPPLEKRIKLLDAAAGNVVGSIDDVDIDVVSHACGRLRNAFAHSLDSRPISNLGSVQVAHAALSLIGFSFLLTKLGMPGEAAAATVRSSAIGKPWLDLVSEHWTLLNDPLDPE